MQEYLKLFFAFMRIGGFTFGGGYAMLPMIQREIVQKNKWATEEEIIDYFAVAQCTPGVIAVNTATFIGNKRKGALGGIIATLGVVFIPVIVICVVASFLKSFSHIPVIKNALWGIGIAVCASILSSFVKMFKKSVIDIVGFCVFIISLVIGIFLKISPVIVVIVAAIFGILIKNINFNKKISGK